MILSKIVENLDYKLIQGDINKDITDLCYDSRKFQAGNLFIAVKGFESDGHKYIPNILEKGGKVIIVEDIPQNIPEDITVIQVDNSRQAMGITASSFFEMPTEKMNCIGITGTNGKTSITFFIKSILKTLNKSIGIVGTIGVLMNEELTETSKTTPESIDLQNFCHQMVQADISHCLMEVSSHALSLHRVEGCDFDTGIFTNLTPDHLELHGDMESYFEAKAMLFNMTKRNVINIDDPHGLVLYKRHLDNTITYGLTDEADVYASDIQSSLDGTTFLLNTPKGTITVHVHLPGIIYVYNALAAAAWAIGENLDLEDIKNGLDALLKIRGRLETAYNKDNKRVIIDFAHTEDSLQKALETLRPFVTNELKVLFGVYAAPGALGLDKRQAMARVAVNYADYAYVTSDNPKKQNPHAIIKDICDEMDRHDGQYKALVDRKKAIHLALDELNDGDVLLIAGKGHETAQMIDGQAVPFSEIDIVKDYMN